MWESIEQIDQVIKGILRRETCLQKTERWKTMTCLKSTSQCIWLERLKQSIGSRSGWTKKQRTLGLPILGWKDEHIILSISQYSFQTSHAGKQQVSVLLRKFPGPGNEALPVKVTFEILIASGRQFGNQAIVRSLRTESFGEQCGGEGLPDFSGRHPTLLATLQKPRL